MVNTVTSGMESTAQDTLTLGYGQETTLHNNSVNQSLNHFQKTAFGFLNTAEATYKNKYQRIHRGVNNNGLNKEESKVNEYEVKFTNKARAAKA